MKGLLRKDLYLVWKYYKFYFLMIVIFEAAAVAIPENPFFLVYPPTLLGIIPVSLQQMDEKSKWDVFAGTLPCTRAQIVSGKYLLSLMFALPLVVLTLAVHGVYLYVTGSFTWEAVGNLTAIISTAAFAMPTISMPLMFKLGAERSRIVNFIFVGIVCGGATAAGLVLDAPVVSIRLPGPAVVLLLLILYALSWLLAVKLYEKRDIG